MSATSNSQPSDELTRSKGSGGDIQSKGMPEPDTQKPVGSLESEGETQPEATEGTEVEES